MKLKVQIKAKGLSVKEFSEKNGYKPHDISAICSGTRIPKTNTLARLCWQLQCYPSDIVTFTGYEVNAEYFSKSEREPLPSEAEGELSYKPLWLFLAEYLADHEGKTPNDLFNKIEPPRRVNGSKHTDPEVLKKARDKLFGENYVPKRTNNTDYSRGLPSDTRTKLRNDRPLNLAVIYEICKFLRCSIDFVMSYK
jgi:DNA-binding Xre family transcriptional regulator